MMGKNNIQRTIIAGFYILFISYMLNFPANALAADPLEKQVDDLVHQHYMDGIQYTQAKALGPGAVPYLVKLLNTPAEKEFWVNIIVTLGFIEDSSAADALISFLDNAQGEVDVSTFRALLSVPFAIGSIASTGDSNTLSYLVNKVAAGGARWSFKGKNIDNLIAEQAVVGLAVSGLPQAKSKLIEIQSQIRAKNAQGVTNQNFLIESIKDGLGTMDRIKTQGRENAFNP